MERKMVVVRTGNDGDARLLAEMGAETFFDSYVDQIAEGVLAEFVGKSFATEIQATELADERSTFFVAEMNGEAVGYARLMADVAPRQVVEEPARRQAIELQRIYVRKVWIGRGVGASLMGACLDEARRQGADLIWLGVWEQNTRAIRFYEKWGFEAVGAHMFQMGQEVQHDVLMRRVLISLT